MPPRSAVLAFALALLPTAVAAEPCPGGGEADGCRPDTPAAARAADWLAGSKLYYWSRPVVAAAGEKRVRGELLEEVHLCRDGNFIIVQRSSVPAGGDRKKVTRPGVLDGRTGRWTVVESEEQLGLYLEMDGNPEGYAGALLVGCGTAAIDGETMYVAGSTLCP